MESDLSLDVYLVRVWIIIELKLKREYLKLKLEKVCGS